MTKSIKVKVEDREIEIKKLPIGRYAELLKSIKELPKHLVGLDKLDKETVLEKIPELLGVATPDLVNIIAIATEIEPEVVLTYGLREITDLLVAIIEVNEYGEVYEKIKKAMAQYGAPALPIAKTTSN